MAIPEERLLEPKEPFPLEKILTVSLKDWMDSKGVPPAFLSDYEIVGVHAKAFSGPHDLSTSVIQRFAEQVPEGTKVVVGYRMSISDKYGVASGTALVPNVFPEV